MASAPPISKPINPLLAKYLLQLAVHPLRTKAYTAGILNFLQEILGSTLAGVPAQKDAGFLGSLHIDSKAFAMAGYGTFVAAPLGHVLVGALQKAFVGKEGFGAKVGQILASNLLVAPIQTTAFLASMAIINGARTVDEIIKAVKSGFLSVMRITWITSPLALVLAQQFVPVELWVPFFNFLGFAVGTYFNVKIKTIRLKEARRRKDLKGE